jgi:hypothetical protein
MNEKMQAYLGIKPTVVITDEVKPDAVEKGIEPEGDQPEHQDGDEGGQATEAGGGDSNAESGQAKPKKRRSRKK